MSSPSCCAGHTTEHGCRPRWRPRFSGKLAQPFDLDGQSAHVGASIGIALFPDDGQESAQLFRNADLAMRRAKEAGRNAFQFFEPVMTEAAQTRRALEADFRHALERTRTNSRSFCNRSSICAIIASTASRCSPAGAAACEEWVPPDRFIPLAEETGLIHEFSQWMLAEACRWLAALKAEASHLHLAVNLSSRQIPDRLSLDWLSANLGKTPADPSRPDAGNHRRRAVGGFAGHPHLVGRTRAGAASAFLSTISAPATRRWPT
jgi:predicted signal transduction protein with EAL and GGDEF domain